MMYTDYKLLFRIGKDLKMLVQTFLDLAIINRDEIEMIVSRYII